MSKLSKLRVAIGKALLLAAALLATMFLASGASLWHVDAPGAEATCQICHLAHMPVLPGLSTGALPAPTTLDRFVLPAAQVALATQIAPDSPPRAPPA